jgi:hypothetical protein
LLADEPRLMSGGINKARLLQRRDTSRPSSAIRGGYLLNRSPSLLFRAAVLLISGIVVGLTLTAVPAHADPIRVSGGPAPVKFSGTLNGFDIDTGALLFTRSLYGSGTGRVLFYGPNPPFFDYQNSLGPVPEPASMLLFGTGVAWIIIRRRGARRENREPQPCI